MQVYKKCIFLQKNKKIVSKKCPFLECIYEGRIFPKMKGVVSMKNEYNLKGGRHFFQNFL